MTSTAQTIKALFQEAVALHTSGRIADAEARYTEILDQDANHPDALHLLGVLKLQQGHADKAVELIERAVSLKPDSAEMHVNLGAAHRSNENPAKAAGVYRRSLDLNPDMDAAHFNLGHALKEMEDFEGAAKAYTTYLAKNPNDAEALNILGDTYLKLGRYDDAMDAYESALIYDPRQAGAVSNIATILRDQGWHHAARTVIDRAIEQAPSDHDILRTSGVIHLQLEDFENGWVGFESRFHTMTEQVLPRSTPPAYWDGEDLSGKSVVVWTEQGLGDEVLHASILPEVIARAERCTIECSKRMVPVFARSFPSATVVGYEASDIPVSAADAFDYQIPLASLGRHFRPDLASFPRHDGYLKADPDKIAALRARYEALANGRRIVGLSWRSKNERAGEAKSMTLSELAPILQTPGVMFVNLQYGDCSKDLADVRDRFGVDVVQDTNVDPLTDMDMFFAQVAAMDLVLSTSNTTAHVAGAQNIPVWVLLPHGSKGLIWYWFLRRTDSPWYPSARLVRADHKLEEGQARWLELTERTAADLGRWAGA